MRVKKSVGIDGHRSLAPLYSPRGPNQKRYVEYLDDPAVSILLGVGPAGTGKTLFACSAAVQEMKRGAIQKIILTRPVVSVEEDIGFLPGSLIAKMDPWTRPIFDILGEFYTQKDVDSMLHSGAIEISPLAYMRGRTFKKSFIIADEMQNSSPNQMLMLTTRLGQGSKMVITGDLKQSDRMTNNGLLDIMNKLKVYQGDSSSIKVVEMGLEDVERSAVVSNILDIYRDPEPIPNHSPSSVVVPKVEVALPLKANFGVENDCALIPLNYFK
jgi:phosphate starvation-inducible PhoH-like protein